MKFWVTLAASLLLTTALQAQVSRSILSTYNNTYIIKNGKQQITGPVLNTFFGEIIPSMGVLTDINTWTGANTFTQNPTLAGCIGFPYSTGSASFTCQTSVNLATQVTGVLQASQMPALSGDVTTPGGSFATTVHSIGGKNVTLGGALTTTGSFSLGLTLTGNTSITLPTAGTLPTLTAPTINVGSVCGYPVSNLPCIGGSSTLGLKTGHMAIGAFATAIDAFVGLNQDEMYVNPNQEMRGLNSTVRHYFDASHTDDPTLGWDSIPIVGTTVIDAANVQNIVGNAKAVVAQLYFEGTTGHNYTVGYGYGFQASIYDLAPQVTLQHLYGTVVNGSPQGITGGIIQQNYAHIVQSMTGQNVWGMYITGLGGTTTSTGIEITSISSGTSAAIKIDGTGTGNAIKFPNTMVYEDSGGKLNLSLNSNLLVFINQLVATSATTGGATALPANPAGYLQVQIGGTGQKIPYYNN